MAIMESVFWLLLVGALTMLLIVLWHVVHLNRGHALLREVLLRQEAGQDEQSRSLSRLAGQIENARATAEAVRLLRQRVTEDHVWLESQGRRLEALALQMGKDFSEMMQSSATLAQSVRELHESMIERIDSLERAVTRAISEQSSQMVQSTRGMLADVYQSLHAGHRAQPAINVPAEPACDQTTECDKLQSAKSLVFVRPLLPYPGWRFDVDLKNPDLAFQARYQLWSYFSANKLEVPFVMDWHHGLRLNVYLGNDLSKQLFIGGCFESNEFAFLDKILVPGMIFVDAGANDGLYTLLASRRVGPLGEVWAFEPSQRESSRLQKNLELNSLTNVKLLRVALSDYNGEGELSVAGYEHEGQNTLGAFSYEATVLLRKETVPVRKLDDLAAERQWRRLDILKADVEGAEFRLFHGAENVLNNMRPILIFEFSEQALQNQGNKGEELLELLRSFDYRIYTFDESTGQPAPSQGVYSDNLVAAPAERPLP